MTKMLVAVLALAAMGFLAYRTMYGSSGLSGDEAPKQRLENVQNKADEWEKKAQENVQDVEKKMQE